MDIEAVLAKHSGVRELAQSGWVNLFVVENGGKQFIGMTANNLWNKI